MSLKRHPPAFPVSLFISLSGNKSISWIDLEIPIVSFKRALTLPGLQILIGMPWDMLTKNFPATWSPMSVKASPRLFWKTKGFLPFLPDAI